MHTRFTPAALVVALLTPLAAWSQVTMLVNIGPPPLLVYEQPMVPGEGYIWTPGYWGWSQRDREYYWIPGTWVLAPQPGYLWTPGYWAYGGGGYLWNLGYWGPLVGFYGGINYGHGYGGNGYNGGRWSRDVFSYNRAYNNLDPAVVHNVYNTQVVNNYRINNIRHVSFNGGPGGVAQRPSAAQLRVQRGSHAEPTPHQTAHERSALENPTQRAGPRGSAAQVAATPRPSAFTEPGVVHARGDAAVRPVQGREVRRAANPVQPPAPAMVESRPAQPMPPAHAQPRGRSAEAQTQRAPAAEQQAQQAPRAARPAQQRPEPAARPEPRQQQGEREQRHNNKGEGRGRDKQRDERP